MVTERPFLVDLGVVSDQQRREEHLITMVEIYIVTEPPTTQRY